MKPKIIFVLCLSTNKFIMLKNIYCKQTVLFYDCFFCGTCTVYHVIRTFKGAIKLNFKIFF